jgi:activator of 2-hydroxyglutaryl-CoA dehydratase
MLENLNLEKFSQHLNSKFIVKHESGTTVELQLIEAKPSTKTPAYEQFSLLFLGPPNAFLQQATYSFEHEQLEAFEMFIVPVKQVAEGFHYEAIISRQL